MQNNQNQVVGAIIIAGLIIGGAILLKDGTPRQDLNDTNKIELDFKAVGEADHIKGTNNAEIVIVEYSDTECPFCKNFHNTMNQVIDERGDDVAWIYRHYPILQLHSKALNEAIATECAWEQGGNDIFWQYIDTVFEITPSNDGLDEKELFNIANNLGLDSVKFKTCLESGKYENKVKEDFEGGANAGVTGTPKSFIITSKNISKTQEKEITSAMNKPNGPEAVSFYVNKNILSLNGALPKNMVDEILDILLK